MDYVALYNRMVVTPRVYAEAVKIAIEIEAEPRYKLVEKKTGVPAILIGALHEMESSRNFKKSFFNGDDGLTSRTHVGQPYGQPKHPDPPYTWEQVAIAALAYDDIHAPLGNYPEMCKQAVIFNGFGYERHNVVSPYGFAGTNLYKKGKFVADSRYSPDHVSTQIGACVILKAHETLIKDKALAVAAAALKAKKPLLPVIPIPPFVAAKPPVPFVPMTIPRGRTVPSYPIPISPRPPYVPPVYIPPAILTKPTIEPFVAWHTLQAKSRTYEPLEPKVRFSKNITNGDLTKGGARPFPNITVELCYRELAERLDAVSYFYGGKKILVDSGHRTEAGNRAAGGAPHSRHTGYFGCAVDITVKGVKPHQVFRDFTDAWQGGMGDGEDFTHFDLREDFTARWGYDSNGHYLNN